MGDIFQLSLRFICGHAVENCFARPGAPAVGRTDVGTSSNPSNPSNPLPPFWGQPQNRLQMACAFSPPRLGWPARPLAPSSPLAPTTRRALGQSHPGLASSSSALGGQENLAAAPPDFSAPPGAVCALYSSVLAAGGAGTSAPSAGPQGAVPARTRIDTTEAPQPGVDRGFQGLVLHRRWPAAGAVDRARSVQPLRAVFAVAAQSGRHGRTPGFSAFVSSAGVARHHPGGQWFALRGHRGVGIVAVVGLVAAVGHPRQVHPPGTPGRQRGPRTVSRLLPAGGGGRGRPATTTPATAFGSLVDELQSRPSARGLGTTHASRSLSPESAALSPGAATLGLSQSLGSTTSAQPGTHQMAWTTAVHRSGFCGPEPRTKIGGRSALGGVSGQTTHRPTPRQGCRRSAPRSLAAPVVIEGVTVLPMSGHSCVTHVLSPCPPGAVFSALAENIGRAKISETSMSVTHATGWTRGASSNTRGGCAPQLRSSGFYPVFCFYPASARYFRVATGRSCQIFMAISIPISANGIRKYGQ